MQLEENVEYQKGDKDQIWSHILGLHVWSKGEEEEEEEEEEEAKKGMDYYDFVWILVWKIMIWYELL